MQGDCGGQGRRRVERAQEADHDGSRLEQGLVGGAERIHHGEQVSFAENGRSITRNDSAGRGIGVIRRTGAFACTGFDNDLDALGDEVFEALRQQSDPSLARRGFLDYA